MYFSLRNKIISSYRPLVHDCIRKSSVRVGDYDEMVSIGYEALISATEAFDPWRGFKFSTYACRSILYRFSSTARKNKNAPKCLDVAEVDASAPVRDPNIELQIERIKIAVENANLTFREKCILSLRFAEEKRTLKDVCGMFGLSKERIRQIQIKAIEKLKEYLEKDEFVQ